MMSALNTSPAPVTATISPYAQVGARLIDAGYSALPIKPGTKIPGEMWSGSWKDGMRAWQRFCDRLPLPFEIDIWEGYPDAGVCVATGFNGLVAIDIDTDEPELIAAIMSVLPYSDAKKRGARGRLVLSRQR